MCLTIVLGWCQLGQAQSPTLYGYVDGAGVAHLSYQPVDARFPFKKAVSVGSADEEGDGFDRGPQIAGLSQI